MVAFQMSSITLSMRKGILVWSSLSIMITSTLRLKASSELDTAMSLCSANITRLKNVIMKEIMKDHSHQVTLLQVIWRNMRTTMSMASTTRTSRCVKCMTLIKSWKRDLVWICTCQHTLAQLKSILQLTVRLASLSRILSI